MKTLIKLTQATLLIGSIVFMASCGKETSPITGWNYNDAANGGFEVLPYAEQETGPGLVLVEGGTFTMGRVEQDVNANESAETRINHDLAPVFMEAWGTGSFPFLGHHGTPRFF